MKKIILRIVLALVFVGIITTFVILHLQMEKVRYNTGYVNGNQGGNLYNGGLFCEYDGTIFFANPDDNFILYSMNPDGTNLKKICSDSVLYINVDDNYIYYVRSNSQSSVDFSSFSFQNKSLCRFNRRSKRIKILDSDPSMYPSLIGNEIYYLHYDNDDATTLYKIDIDGTNKKQVMNSYVFPCSTQGQYFYYNGTTTNGNLYRYDAASKVSETIFTCSCYKPIAIGNDFYYMDVTNDTAIVHYDPSTGETTTLSERKVDAYNVSEDYVYYQTYGDDPALYRVSTNGSSEPEKLYSGIYNNINITSDNIYFMDANTQEMYYMPINDPGKVDLFHPGKVG